MESLSLVCSDGDRRGWVALNLHHVGVCQSLGKSLVLLNLAFLFCSQNLKLEGTEDLSEILVKKDN